MHKWKIDESSLHWILFESLDFIQRVSKFPNGLLMSSLHIMLKNQAK